MTAIETLEAALPSIPSGKRDFAQSLINQSRTRALSDKQMFWVRKLAEDAMGQTVPAKTAAVGDLSGIVALFDRARQNLKFPAVVLQVATNAAGIDAVRISVAGENSKAPGSLNVTSVDRSEVSQSGFPQRRWFGRVGTDGTYTASAKASGAFVAITEKLQAFSADPAGVAAEYGRLTGNCCFCAKALTDERSTAVGYGQKCASNYGLPWGAKA